MNPNLKRKEHIVDLCVVGGGISGMCAAISAARHGLKVALMHDRPMLGGNTSSEVRMWLSGAGGKNNRETGIVEELCLENLYRNPYRSYPIWDSVLYGSVATEENIDLILNCSCNDVEMDGTAIKKVYGWQSTSQQWHSVEAKYFVDSSGDSILAPLSGAEFRHGHEAREEFNESIAPVDANTETMGNSCLLQLRQKDEEINYIPPKWAKKFTDEEIPAFGAKNVSANTILNFCMLETGGEKNTIDDAEEIREDLIKIAYGIWDLIKNGDTRKEDAKNWDLDFVGYLPGKRESRRYMGDYILTQNDVEAEGRFDDIVAYGGWSMDDHDPKGLYSTYYTYYHPAPSPYGIPYRCIYSKNIDNLFCAGRNISTTHVALASTRVMNTCATLGQAAGTAAAVAAKYGVSPRDVYNDHIDELKQMLMEDDCYLPFNKMEMSPIVKSAKITSSGKNVEDLTNGHTRPIGDDKNSWSGGVGDWISFEFEKYEKISRISLIFDSDLNRETIGDQRPNINQKPTVHNIFLDAPKVHLPETLVKAFTIEAALSDGTTKTIAKVDGNYQRLVNIDTDIEAKSVKVIVNETTGNDEVNIFSINIK